MNIGEQYFLVSPNGRYQCAKEEIGRGASKIVYKGIDTETDRVIACSVIKYDQSDMNEKKDILNELYILQFIQSIKKKNDFILRYLDSWTNDIDSHVVFVTEFAPHKSLDKHIRNTGIPKLNVVKRWSKQILQGIRFLHKNGIIHRDIKCSNIFYNGYQSKVLIGDFGIAKKLGNGQTCKTITGTQLFMAPEMWDGQYNFEVDIYAFGLVVVEMMTGKVPFAEHAKAPVWISKFNTEPPQILSEFKDTQVLNFVNRCICWNYSDRATLKDLLNDDFLVINDMKQEFDEKKFKKSMKQSFKIPLKQHSGKKKSRRDSMKSAGSVNQKLKLMVNSDSAKSSKVSKEFAESDSSSRDMPSIEISGKTSDDSPIWNMFKSAGSVHSRNNSDSSGPRVKISPRSSKHDIYQACSSDGILSIKHKKY